MEKNLDDLRKEIDIIDSELTALLEKRIDVVRNIGRYKKAHNIAISAPVRELNKIQELFDNQNPKNAKYLVKTAQHLFNISKEIQAEIFDEEK